MTISVIHIDQDYFEVTLSYSITTKHKIKVTNEAHLKYSGRAISKSQLVTKALLFLLRRESNASILEEFSIEEIENFFPEFKNFGRMDWVDLTV